MKKLKVEVLFMLYQSHKEQVTIDNHHNHPHQHNHHKSHKIRNQNHKQLHKQILNQQRVRNQILLVKQIHSPVYSEAAILSEAVPRTPLVDNNKQIHSLHYLVAVIRAQMVINIHFIAISYSFNLIYMFFSRWNGRSLW